MEEPASPAAKAEQRAVLVARLKRAASLPRMKDGRRPPMHAEAVSESEKGQQPESSAPTTDVEDASTLDPTSAEPQQQQQHHGAPSTPPDEPTTTTTTNGQHTPKDGEESLPVAGGFDTEGDAETEDRPFSPNPSGRSRRRRSRSRSRTSKDFKAKNRAPTPAPTGDSSPDEAPPIPVAVPIFPALLQPVPVTSHLPPQFIPYQQAMFGAVPESLFYPGTSPPTPLPLPTLEALQKGLMRSNSAGGTQASRRLALAKLTGGTDTYDPSPSPTPPPLPGSGLTRNNTVAGGERFAARQLMLGRIAGRVAKETDTEQVSGASGEDRGAPSPGPDKRRRRRSRRRSSAAANPAVSDSDPVSTPSQTPVPPPLFSSQFDSYSDLRTASTTPNQASSSSRNHSNEHVAAAATPPPPPLPDVSADRQEHRRRSVLIEDDEDEVRYQPQPRIPTISHTPPPPRASPHISMLRSVLQRSDSPAMHSPNTMHLNGVNDPSSAYLARASPARQVPPSPFATPLKEKDRQLSDDEEERVIYPAETLRPRTPATNANIVDYSDREISWVATPVPELRSQANDDDDDYDEYDEDVVAEVVVKDERDQYQEDGEPPQSPSSTQGFLHHEMVYDDLSPRVSTSSKSIVIESEASADVYPIRIDSSAFNIVPVSVSQSESYGQPRSPLNSEYSEWEDRSTATNELTTKRSVEANSPSTWEKMKSTFSRSGSSAGRRSRTNSILNRGDPRNSNISRESQGSLTSGGGRVEKSDSLTPQTTTSFAAAPQLMHSNSASASMLSLPQHSPFRGNPSPIPPATPADMSKYQNDKLFPFPGMKKLEEQRNRDRARAFPFTSASTPDVTQLINGHEDVNASPSAQSFSPPPQSKESSRERKDSVTTQATQPNEPRLGYSPVRQPGYIDLPPLAASTSTSKGKLPVTFTEVKQWLSKNKGKKAQQSQGGSTTPLAVTLPPQIELQSSTSSTKKLSLSDLLKSKDTDINSDWEDTRTPTNGPASATSTSSPPQPQPQPQPHKAFSSFGYRSGRETPATAHTDSERTPKAKKVLPLTLSQSSDSRYVVEEQHPPESAKTDRYLSPTPDPTSSVSEAPPSTSESSSTTSSQYSLGPTPQAQALLEKLDDSLSRGIAPLDEPPRKLLFSGPVLQVVDPNTVKDRFLFLFNDILIIAKPILQGKAVFNDSSFSNPTDKKYMIKSVVRFRDLRFCQERAEPPPKSFVPSSIPNSPSLRAFIAQFASNPAQAVAGLSARSRVAMDSALLAQVLFKTTELNKRQLGEYLCHKGSKNVLKAFLDNFGFTSLRIDVALRIFLHSIHLENTEAQGYTMDHVQETFASRWYEANAKIVAFDKDMALRLVRAIIQLNELLHGSIASEVGAPSTGRNITTRDFYEAFRRYDPRRLVSDDQLDDIYFSIRQERLMQARSPASVAASPDVHISFMRPLPARLTYKAQSDPIIIRLPQPDPTLSLQLFGHDLTFEPSVLSFTKSPEASFRVTGNSLGTKTLVILRSGPNAIKYSGLPLSYHIPVERSFMRNTFQIAFLNHQGAKRRYMFSVDDHLMRHQWATSIRQQIEKSLATTVTPTDHALPPGVSDFYRAAEEVSFKVLQETLIQSTGSSSSNGHTVGYQHHHHHPHTSAEKDSPGAHRRSKSRSRMYPRQGAGKVDYDLAGNSHRFNDSRDSNETDGGESAGAGTAGGGPYENGKTGGRIWSGRELELHCQQNSLIPNVLSHLQNGIGPTS